MLRLILTITLAAQASSFQVGMRLGVPRASRAQVSLLAAPKKTDANGVEIKAALSSYMHFCQERRPGLVAELKASMGSAFKNPAVMTALGSEWKALGEAEKARFAALATADKARYDAAVASNPANASIKRARKKSSGPKKLSAYMHFCADRRPSLTAELKASMGAAFKQPAVMTQLGAEWRQLDPASKARFEQLAAAPVE